MLLNRKTGWVHIRLGVLLFRTWRSQWTRSNKIKAVADRLHGTVPQLFTFTGLGKVLERVLTMVYNTRNYWGFGVCPSSGIVKNTPFRKLDLLPSSGERVKTPTLLGPLERANLNHWTRNWTPSAKKPFVRKSCRCFQVAQFTRAGLPRTLFVGRQYFRQICLQMIVCFKMLPQKEQETNNKVN
jgi:hypothetical protein